VHTIELLCLCWSMPVLLDVVFVPSSSYGMRNVYKRNVKRLQEVVYHCHEREVDASSVRVTSSAHLVTLLWSISAVLQLDI
jgi:hypothetical protein